MINQIFFDLDECLISGRLHVGNEFNLQYDFAFRLDDEMYGNQIYQVKINPCAWNIINHARDLVGRDNVLILTASTQEYAEAINGAAPFGFPKDQIIAREKLDKAVWNMRFCPEYVNPFKNKNNVLIDNLRPRENEDKMIFLGIGVDNYHQVCDFYGVASERFEEGVIEFLDRKYGETNK